MNKMLTYFDVHGHIQLSDYDADREEVIRRASELGIGMIIVGTDARSSKKAVALAEAHEGTWACVGIHPTDIEGDIDFPSVQELARHPKVVAIGECGLDFFHSKPEAIPFQKEVLLQHINLAKKVKKPLMLHVRNAKVPTTNAYQETISILKEHPEVRANFHFFAGTIQDSNDIVAMGHSLSFNGVLTFARDYDEIVKTVPLAHIMSETDCPYVAPAPYRGKRNESSYVTEVVKKIAEIRGEELDVVAKQLAQNAKDFFNCAG
ncbi:MAG: TatD family hydrolase [bacterium]|nr:TatD family hydrolase [bacterium]